MKKVIYFLFISVALYACKQEEPKISIVGKWHHISKNGYSELEIDSQYVVAFSEKMGKSKLEYKIEKDSFKYLTINYSAKIILSGDSLLILRGNDNYEATLVRYDESERAFESVPDDEDSIRWDLYERSFVERANLALKKAGYIRPE